MSHLIYKLKFTTGLHVGVTKGSISLAKSAMSIYSDTFYSSLLNEIAGLFGENQLEEFKDLSTKGEFLVSDLMPFDGYDLYIKKPYLFVKREKHDSLEESASSDKKRIKNLQYIPVTHIQEYVAFLRDGGAFPFKEPEFGTFGLTTKNQIDPVRANDTQLYAIEAFHFKPEAGLYTIVSCPANRIEQLEKALLSLGERGIGGKKSSGYGKFTWFTDPMELDIDDPYVIESPSDMAIAEGLSGSHDRYITLGVYKPTRQEVKQLQKPDSYYQLVKRSGFVSQPSYEIKSVKRKAVHMLDSGSWLTYKPVGEVMDLRLHGRHSIYRLGKPLSLGV